MNEAEFSQLVDDVMFSIEESIDDSGANIDYENTGGLLTLTCDINGSQIILSRQSALKEIWLAAVSGGFHFTLQGDDPKRWCNTVSGQLLTTMLADACMAQANEQVDFAF
ncbi:MAG TPA: iron donor protein CyaY [Porticoccaceae bacterium]|jgi:CyaY protein|nr:iron donor protein CyaY [Porticoccaceae bacterium]